MRIVKRKRQRSGRSVPLLNANCQNIHSSLQAMKASMPAELQDDDLFDEEDDLPSDVEDDDDEESAEEDDDNNDGDDEALSLVEASDNEDLLSLGEDIPDGLIDFEGPESGSDGEEWGGIDDLSKNKKRKRSGDETKEKRKKLRSLPTFASYEDYAKMIEDGPEDNI